MISASPPAAATGWRCCIRAASPPMARRGRSSTIRCCAKSSRSPSRAARWKDAPSSSRRAGWPDMALVSPRVTLAEPWLEMDLGYRHQIAGWPIVGPSWGMAATIDWLQVRDADLPADVLPETYFKERARIDRIEAEIGLMTAADIANY